MAISIPKLRTIGIRGTISWRLRNHASEIVIVGIMVTIVIGVAFLATGDVMEAIARSRAR